MPNRWKIPKPQESCIVDRPTSYLTAFSSSSSGRSERSAKMLCQLLFCWLKLKIELEFVCKENFKFIYTPTKIFYLCTTPALCPENIYATKANPFCAVCWLIVEFSRKQSHSFPALWLCALLCLFRSQSLSGSIPLTTWILNYFNNKPKSIHCPLCVHVQLGRRWVRRRSVNVTDQERFDK